MLDSFCASSKTILQNFCSHIRKVVSALISVTERKLSRTELYKVESHISDRLGYVAGAWKYLGERKNWHAKFLRPLLPSACSQPLLSRDSLARPILAPTTSTDRCSHHTYFLSNDKHPRCDCMFTITYLMCFFSFLLQKHHRMKRQQDMRETY